MQGCEGIDVSSVEREEIKMSRVLIIGCGGVASVAIHKCCQVSEVFTEICIASRTKEKCDKLAAELAPKTKTVITTARVDADKTDEVIELIKSYQPDLVMNIALPYQDLTIMPWWSMVTISPGSTSRIYSAPRTSNAQVSLATT